MAYWWVNQNQTWAYEVAGGYLWSPKKNANGRRSQYYDNMTLMEVGDIVLSYNRKAIRSVGLVEEIAISSPKPDFGTAGANWDEDGWEVLVRFIDVPIAVRPQDHLELFNQTASGRYDPMNSSGSVNQFYLYSIDPLFGEILVASSGIDVDTFAIEPSIDKEAGQLLQEAIAALQDERLTRTQRKQLGFARIGQGMFKDRVALREASCRLTGLGERQHLIASHIKPWKDSDNAERLNGDNGLLLSPHIDHLFDRGFISFRDSGEAIQSSLLLPSVSTSWRLDFDRESRPFSNGQRHFLEYHRDTVFKRISDEN